MGEATATLEAFKSIHALFVDLESMGAKIVGLQDAIVTNEASVRAAITGIFQETEKLQTQVAAVKRESEAGIAQVRRTLGIVNSLIFSTMRLVSVDLPKSVRLTIDAVSSALLLYSILATTKIATANPVEIASGAAMLVSIGASWAARIGAEISAARAAEFSAETRRIEYEHVNYL